MSWRGSTFEAKTPSGVRAIASPPRQAHPCGPAVLDQNFRNARAGSNLAALGLQVPRKRQRQMVHAALHRPVAQILNERCEQPGQLAATDVVRPEAHVTRPRADKQPRLFPLEVLLGPRADALQPGAIRIHPTGAPRHLVEFIWKWRRRRVHPARDIVLRPDEIGGKPPPRLPICFRVSANAGDGILHVTVHGNDPAAGKHVRVVDLGPYELETEVNPSSAGTGVRLAN